VPDLPALETLFERNRFRLQGIRGWADLARLGKSNLRRLRELFAEDATAALASPISADERRDWNAAAQALHSLEANALDDKPTLIRFRVENFPIGAEVCLYAGDTPDSLATGWVRGHIVSVRKAFRPDWNDGSPNAGYFWELGIEPLTPVWADTRALHASPSEPRLLHARDFVDLFRAKESYPEFFRIFVDNAQRSWTPLWCVERGLQLSPEAVDVRSWFMPPLAIE